jgi:glycine oxidase
VAWASDPGRGYPGPWLPGARSGKRAGAMRVVVVGGGVMGCATALALADRGAEVLLLERAVPGAEASSAAAGILGAQMEAKENAALLPLFVRARAEYRGWAEVLRARTGIDIAHKVTGGLRVGLNEADARAIDQEVAWQRAQGLRVELVDGRGAREIEPHLAEGVLAGAYYPDEAQVEPHALLRALATAVSGPIASGGRVTVRAGTTVQRLIVEGNRCVGAELEEGDERGDAIVLAAGSWSTLLQGVPAEVPRVRPARGQMVLLDERPPRVRSMLFGPGVYVVPRGDGRVLCGSTLELVGYQRGVTAGGVQAILSGALLLVPTLAGASLTSTWSNFRPFLGDHAPLMGASPLPGLFLATGHHRNGILLAKVTADAVTRAILGEA